MVSKKSSRWDRAIELPGLGALNKGRFADVISVSCAPAGTCRPTGSDSHAHGHSQAFVVSQTG